MTTASPRESAELSPLCFERLAVLAVSPTAQVDLCRMVQGEHYGAFAAVKRLQPDISEDIELRNMFRDEIWMAKALEHPNVARVLGWGEDDTGPFLASEFVRGVSLARLMRTVFATGEAFTERLIVFVAAKICAGLAAAHDLRSPTGEFLNLVHRDLTPGNVLLGFDGSVKITDFGLAKAKQRVTQTAVGMTKGDPAYMSPEQVMGADLDGRSDIFAFGIVLYELFAQRRPWMVQNMEDALLAIVEGPTPPLAKFCPRMDTALTSTVERCLKKKPADRFQTAHELKRALDEWLMLHGYQDSGDTLARFVRRNAMRQMRWVDRALRGELKGRDPRKYGPSPLELSRDEPAYLEPPPPTEASAPIELKSTSSGPTHGVEVTDAATQRRPRHKSESASGTGPSIRSRRQTSTGTSSHARERDAAPPLGATADSQIPLDPRQVADAYARAFPDAQHQTQQPPTEPQIPRQRSASESDVSGPADETAKQPRRRRPEPAPVEASAQVTRNTQQDLDEGLVDEPSTLRRAPLVTELQEVARQVALGASSLADKAARAAHEASAAAKQADVAARRAHAAALRAGKMAEAARRAAEAVGHANAGDVAKAVACAQESQRLQAEARAEGE